MCEILVDKIAWQFCSITPLTKWMMIHQYSLIFYINLYFPSDAAIYVAINMYSPKKKSCLCLSCGVIAILIIREVNKNVCEKLLCLLMNVC